jgi:uncharacterized peroxidase-related enzyme
VHHGEFLRLHSKDDHLVYHLGRDWQAADLDEQERAMLRFVVKLNASPGKVAAGDVDALRRAGFDDRGVLDIVLITATFNFMNRLADGLGIRAEAQVRALMERKARQVEDSLAAPRRESAAE